MIAYFFALLTLVASLPLLWVSGAVMWGLLMDVLDGTPLHPDDYTYGSATLALWLVVGYADYHALHLVLGGGA